MIFRKAQPNPSNRGAQTYTILYYTILYYTILYYTIRYYTIRYYTTPTLRGDFLEAAAWPRQRLEPRRPRQGLQGLGPGAAPGRSGFGFFFFLFFLFCFCAGGVGRGISGKSRNGSKRALLSRGEGEVGCWGWENTWIVLVRVPYYSGDFKEGAYSKKTTDISAFCSNYIGVHLVVHDRNIGVQGLGLQGWF